MTGHQHSLPDGLGPLAGLARGQVAVVAGNGPSLAHIAPGRVTGDDAILRTNSFFLEPSYFLGTRVDLAMIAGDPRVVPFLLETLCRTDHQYQLGAWSSPAPKVARMAARRLTCPHVPMRHATPAIAAEVARLMAEYNAVPTAGVQTLLLAHAMGARHILLAGIDLYATPERYAFTPGPRMRRLLGKDLATRSFDSRLHHPDLDRRLIAYLAVQPDVTLQRAAAASPLADLLDLAPVRAGPPLHQPVKEPIADWADWAGGWYPVGALWALRTLRGAQMRLMDRLRRGRQ